MLEFAQEHKRPSVCENKVNWAEVKEKERHGGKKEEVRGQDWGGTHVCAECVCGEEFDWPAVWLHGEQDSLHGLK